MQQLTIILLLFLKINGCNKKPDYTTMPSNHRANKITFTYLALGDSYTVGESVPREQSFPYQLTAKFNQKGLGVRPEIIAQTGWTTNELIEAINGKNDTATYDLVTLLIGVNNQYRNYPKETYRKEFAELLQRSVAYAGGKKNNVFVLSVPDWGVTPFGKKEGTTAHISREIDAFNAISKEETLKMGISYIDITTGSRNTGSDRTFIASDSLHPSGKMYTEWVDKLMPAVEMSLMSCLKKE